jgi:PAS domain S-box-containing protein
MDHLLSFLKTRFNRALLIIVLILGFLTSIVIVKFIDHQIRIDLLDQTHLITQTFDVDRMRFLTGDRIDLISPEYQRVKNLFTAMHAANPEYRFIYLLGRKSDGTIFFIVDSEPAGSPGYSPPGQIYPEASSETRQAFNRRIPFIEGPSSDRWGSWMSILIPLIDPVTGKVFAVAGMDIGTDVWNRKIVARAALPVFLFWVLLFVNFLFILFYHTNKLIQAQQEKLQESGKQFRNMFLGHSAAMLLIEPVSGRILDANNAASEFYGYSKEQLKSKSINEINTLSPGEAAAERLKALHHESNHFLFRHRMASGEIRDVEAYSTPIDAGGETVLFSILHDITERRKNEEILAKLLLVSEEFLAITEYEIDYQKITDHLLQISGAKYAAFNLFDEDGSGFQAVAVSGVGDHLKKATAILGFDPVRTAWRHNNALSIKIQDNLITHLSSLQELIGTILPATVIGMLEMLFNPGEMMVANIFTGGRVIGYFVIIMAPGISFTADDPVSIYIRQVGLLLQRKIGRAHV